MIRLPNNFRREFIQLVIIKIKKKKIPNIGHVKVTLLITSYHPQQVVKFIVFIDASSLLGNNNHNNPMFIFVKNVAVVIENKSHIFVSKTKKKK